MSDKQSIPKGLQGYEMLKFLGLTQDDFKSADKLNSKLFPSMSEAYKKAGGKYVMELGPSGNWMLIILIKFYQDIYSKMEEKDISDEIIIQFLKDNYGDKSPLASLQFWVTKPDNLLESVNLLRGALKINKFSFADFNSQPEPSQQDEDMSTFEPKRFGNKLGRYIGISFGISLLICLMIFTPSLVMNSYIYKPLFMRLVLGFYSMFLFIFLLPYYIFLGIFDNNRSPKMYALFPLVPYWKVNNQLVNNYTWEISKSLIGLDSWFPTQYMANDQTILWEMRWLKPTPHEKDLNPIPVSLESITGKAPVN